MKLFFLKKINFFFDFSIDKIYFIVYNETESGGFRISRKEKRIIIFAKGMPFVRS